MGRSGFCRIGLFAVLTGAAGASGQVTLDQAYDTGGAGRGRTITADAGMVSILGNGGLGNGGLCVESNVGIGSFGIMLPSYSLHIQHAQGIINVTSTARVNGSSLDLRNNTASPALLGSVNFLNAAASPVGSIKYSGQNALTFTTNSSERVRIDAAGNVGVGTATPEARLDLRGHLIVDAGDHPRFFTGRGTGELNRYLQLLNSPSAASASGLKAGGVLVADSYAFANPGKNELVVKGRVGVGIGTPSTAAALHLTGSSGPPSWLNATDNGLLLGSAGTANYKWIQSYGGALCLNAVGNNVGIGTTNPTATLDVAGRVKCDVLEIRGGSDLSEQFDVSSAGDAGVEPGMVVSIDPARAGKLVVSRQAYDRKVAGIISGADGIKPGMVMGQQGSIADGQHPVALSGRVWVRCDSTHGAIEAGDMLTTSAIPGHAMRVDDMMAAQGAIIGKAMSALSSGQRGMVLVLVNLQ
ncbi:MAG: hypothetical protein CHACPFDD_03539 [Phycisphaerae bacterium]|nr:hypothetical protein [Phycisphaerae bacterium]